MAALSLRTKWVAQMVEEPTIEAAAERALMLELMAREIGDSLGQPPDAVTRAAVERAAHKGLPVDDVLRSWVRALLA
ncbi:MAG TPA: hypothetical protein VFC99_18745 [Acidimicrobiia bacterium]|nr:hypothetical protein [Acidimicrobiia bacterium]